MAAEVDLLWEFATNKQNPQVYTTFLGPLCMKTNKNVIVNFIVYFSTNNHLLLIGKNDKENLESFLYQ